MTDYYKDKQQLTDEQIAELAPDWATHYTIIDSDITPSCITFYDGFWHQWFYYKDKNNWSPKLTYNEIPKSAKPIPLKKFDIDLVRREIHKTLTCDNSEKFMKYEDLPGYTIESYDKLIDKFNLTAEDLK